MHDSAVRALSCSRLALLASGTAQAAEVPVPTYTAVYKVQYKGKDVGMSEFSVRYDAQRDLYEFTSSTHAQGLLRLARPNAAVDHSEFRLHAGRIQPLAFSYEDGSRKGEDDFKIAFDWDKHVALYTGDGGRREIALRDGDLDRGSMQVALMRDLIATGKPGRYQLAEDDPSKAYVYTDQGEATIQTGIGMLATHEFVQQRESSSRATYLWVAPTLSYLPVRIEQRKNGELTTAFTLSSVSGLSEAGQ